MSAQYWLMKSEPDVFSFADLKRRQKTLWDGVRNYMARNYMMNSMKPGDIVLFYHSNANPPGAAGLGYVASKAQPDPSAWDRQSQYYDPKSPKEKPRWYCVEVAYLAPLPQFVSLDAIKCTPELKNMVLLKNSRLSVQPVLAHEFQKVLELAQYSAWDILSSTKMKESSP